MSANESVTFDRAGDYYDRTRSLTPEAAARVTELLVGELEPRQPALEIGVGTGRMALPLAARGIELVGLDLSRPMLDKLIEKSPDGAPFPVLLGDATALPFGARSFGSGFAAHVLHLIPTWRRALDELCRVVRPGGLLMIDIGGWDRNSSDAIGKHFSAILGTERVGVVDIAEVDAHMSSSGARPRELPVVTEKRTMTWGGLIDDLEVGLYSITWDATQEERSAAAASVRAWTESELGALDEERAVVTEIKWRAYDLP